MQCNYFTSQLDDYLDGRLDARPLQKHLSGCADCRRVFAHAEAVRDGLRRLSPPEMHPEFVDRAILRATRPGVAETRPRRGAVVGMALAASLVLGLALGVFV